MMLRSGAVVALAVLLFGVLAAGAADAPTDFLQTHYYLLSLGQVAAGVDSIRRTAQSSGYSVITYDGDAAEAFRGTEPMGADPQAVLSDEKLVVIDGGRFLLRESGDGFVFTARPSENGYDLVIDPQQDLPMPAVLGPVLASLQSMGLLGNELSLNVQAYAKDDPKGPPPPTGVAIDSSLYGLLIARDWFDYAATKGLTLVGLRVEVVAEILPDASLEEAFAPYVVDSSGELAKLSLPIDRLLSLARSTAVGYVRPPYRPSVP
jgi:hypothetical protein